MWVNVTEDLYTYEWECPFCGKQKMSLSSRDENGLVGQAENALMSHVRSAVGGGHGDQDEVPPGFGPDAARKHIVFNDETQPAGSPSKSST